MLRVDNINPGDVPHQTKNGKLKMTNNEYQLTDLAKFVCSNGHIFVATVDDVLEGKSVCPVCAGDHYLSWKEIDDNGNEQTLYVAATEDGVAIL